MAAGGDPASDRTGSADTQILSTLAHLGCATFSHLHALCFPTSVIATARLRLAALIEAGLIRHSHWRLPPRKYKSGHVWTVSPQALDIIERYTSLRPLLVPDLGRPSTGREYDEWRVRMDVRTFAVRLILEARHSPLCADLDAAFSLTHPTPLGPLYPATPDALLTVAWHPPTAKAADWLPWNMPRSNRSAVRYAIYLERQGGRASVAQLIERCVNQPEPSIPLVILLSAEHSRIAQDLVWQRGYRRPIRITYWSELEMGITRAPWWDAHGQISTLRPRDDEPPPG